MRHSFDLGDAGNSKHVSDSQFHCAKQKFFAQKLYRSDFDRVLLLKENRATAAALMFAAGIPKFRWLGRLNISARN